MGSSTLIGFNLPEAGNAKLIITDETGRLIYVTQAAGVEGL